MSCGGVSELVIERRGGGGGGGGGGNSVGCRLRGSNTSNSTSPNAKGGGGGGAGATGTGSSTSTGTVATTTTSTTTTTAQGSQQQVPLRPTKPCCFCWCCCCSCSWKACLWEETEELGKNLLQRNRYDTHEKISKLGDLNGISLAVKNVDENGPTKNLNNSDLLNCDGEPPPTLEEIRSWGKSFDKLMRSSAGRKVFRDFLRCEYSEENILFWLACEELKRETNPDVVEEKARKIYEDYISILSPKEVSLDSRVREIVNRNMVEPTPHTFDEAQLQIYTLMHRDSYPRFVNSTLFKTLAQLNSSAASETGSGDADASQTKPGEDTNG